MTIVQKGANMKNFTIIRNGEEIVLTYDEMSAAYKHLVAVKGVDRLEECLDLLENKEGHEKPKLLAKQILKDKTKCFEFEDSMIDIMEEEINNDTYIDRIEDAIKAAWGR